MFTNVLNMSLLLQADKDFMYLKYTNFPAKKMFWMY